MNIFIAFANQDRDVRDKLLRQMNLVKDRLGWNIWSAKEIRAGERWGDEIERRLRDSEVVILLLSTDFFNSEYIIEKELPEVVEKHKRGDCQIIPVIARVCHWKETSFGEYAKLGDIQALPEGERPIMSKTWWGHEDEPYFETVEGIKASIRAFQEKKDQKDQHEREAKERAENERLAAEAQRAKEAAAQLRLEQEQTARRADLNAWQQAADTHDIPAYENYLAQYPQGEYSREVRFRIKELKRKETAPLPLKRYAAIGGGVLALLLAVWLLPKMFSGGDSEEVTPSYSVINNTQFSESTLGRKSGLEMVQVQGGTFTMGSPACDARY